MLQVNGLCAAYGFLQILWDVSLEIADGEFVGLIGPNGAGKSTTLKAIAGLLPPKSGQVVFKGRSIGPLSAHQVTRMGISYISEELNLFTNMSVRENLLLGAYSVKDKETQLESLGSVFDLFPRLKERESQLAGTMSGGERKMLAIARGMMSRPELMLVDEPSLGLAPHLVSDVFSSLQKLREAGVTIMVVEQRVDVILEITDRAYVLEHGRIAMQGVSSELERNEHVKNVYLGI